MNYGKNATKRRVQHYNSKSSKICHAIFLFFCKAVLLCAIVACVVGISAGIGVFKGIIDSAPDISKINITPTDLYTTVLYSDDTYCTKLVAAGSNRKYVSIDEVPKDLQNAFVAIEDERFYQHNGIDLHGIGRALVECIKARDLSQGASTITQQLIKNNVLTSWTSESSKIEKIQRKIQEQYLALELEKRLDKAAIIEKYMNYINLGDNTLGVQAASERYFNKDVSELTLSECAVIAGITQNPSAYNPIIYPENNAKRRKLVLNNMKEQGYISSEQYEEALADDVYDRIAFYNSQTTDSVNTYFVDALIDNVYKDLVEKLGYSESEAYKAIYRGGLKIHSTQDPKLQKICDKEVNNADNYPANTSVSFILSFQVKKADGTIKNYSNQTMASFNKKKYKNNDYSMNFSSKKECLKAIRQYEKDVLKKGDKLVEGSEVISYTMEPQVALTLIDHKTGEVKAIVGGRGEKQGNRTWNRATDTQRQPGSTFKIIGCYAAALDAGGLTLASVQDDSSLTVGSKTFHNYDGSARGFTSIRTAIQWSINIVTVKTLQQMGVDLGYEYAKDFGITTLSENDRNLSLALGGLTNGVTNLELTGAYATIANQGTYKEPKFYTTVEDAQGNILLDINDTQDTHQVIKPSTAWLLTSAMTDVITAGTGGKAYFGTDMAQAGKSGTTTSNRDCLWAGYTPYYTCVVWGGYDDNSRQSGSQTWYPKVIWKNIMKKVHKGLKSKQFKKPGDIVSASVCKKSGLTPIDDVCSKDPRSSMVGSEYFAKGTVPNSSCNHHVKVEICKKSKMICNKYCPETEERVYIVGGSSGSADGQYLATKDFLEKKCTKHNKKTKEKEEQKKREEEEKKRKEEEEQNQPDDPDDSPDNPDEPVEPDNPDNPDNPNAPTNEASPFTFDDLLSFTGFFLFKDLFLS